MKMQNILASTSANMASLLIINHRSQKISLAFLNKGGFLDKIHLTQ